MQKQCAQCSAPYEVTKEDEAFYQKLSPTFNGKTYSYPAPTLCPGCRAQRRMAWRNDRSFHKRKCSLTGKDIVSLYPADTPFPVYHTDDWWSDKWDPMSFGQDYDFNKPFFSQWQELMNKVPRRNMDLVNCQNSQYCNYCGDDKNCYLDIAGEGNEDCFYNLFTKYSTNCVDCTFVYRSQLMHECLFSYDSYACRNSMYLENCTDCAFCFDCKGCKNCLLSINLRNKEYCIFNKPHSREEYFKKLQELNLGSHKAVANVKKLWEQKRIEAGIYRDMYNINCENCFGNNIHNSKNCFYAFNTVDSWDCKYLYDVMEAKDCYDLNYSLYKPEVACELISTLNMRSSACNMASHYCANVFYCDHTDNSKNLFGCIGLNHQEYCILNKKYTKEEYEQLVPKIIEHMNAAGEWGQFFPVSLSPHGYNETVAQEYLPLSKAEVSKRGWNWIEKAEDLKAPAQPPVLPDHIDQVSDDVTNQVLICEKSQKPYKLIPQEVAFYKEQKIPLPHRSAEQRHFDRNELRNPRKLFKRNCAKTNKEIWTSYSPDRPEKIYSEPAYLKEVY